MQLLSLDYFGDIYPIISKQALQVVNTLCSNVYCISSKPCPLQCCCLTHGLALHKWYKSEHIGGTRSFTLRPPGAGPKPLQLAGRTPEDQGNDGSCLSFHQLPANTDDG